MQIFRKNRSKKYHLICFSTGEIEAVYANGFTSISTISYLSSQSENALKQCLDFLSYSEIPLFRSKLLAMFIIFGCLVTMATLVLPVNLLRQKKFRFLVWIYPSKFIFVNDSPAPRINTDPINCYGAQIACATDDRNTYQNALYVQCENNKFEDLVKRQNLKFKKKQKEVIFLTKPIPQDDYDKVVRFLLSLKQKVLIKIHPRDNPKYWSNICQKYPNLSVTETYWVELIISAKEVFGIHSSIAYYAALLEIPYKELVASNAFENWDTKGGNRWHEYTHDVIYLK